jgi:ketopantoate reductase
VLVGVKLRDTESVAASLKPIAERGAAIISFQNGVQKYDILRKYVPAQSLMGGVCFIAAIISEPCVCTSLSCVVRSPFRDLVNFASTSLTSSNSRIFSIVITAWSAKVLEHRTSSTAKATGSPRDADGTDDAADTLERDLSTSTPYGRRACEL